MARKKKVVEEFGLNDLNTQAMAGHKVRKEEAKKSPEVVALEKKIAELEKKVGK